MNEIQSLVQLSFGHISIYKVSSGLVDWMKVKTFLWSHMEIHPFIKRVELVDWIKVKASTLIQSTNPLHILLMDMYPYETSNKL